MIDYIKGQIVELTPTYVVLEANGLGYFISIPLPAYTLLSHQLEAKLFVHEVVREDAYLFFGFITKKEREVFQLLISVSGIGVNTARMIMSSYSVEEIQEIIAAGNVSALNAIKGIGSKTAQRIIVDLKDKILKGKDDGGSLSLLSDKNAQIKEEAVSALVMLGFPVGASQKAIENILKEQSQLEVEQLIKMALKIL
ncbi:MAG: Holliday junction branch migration protein RuvA [Paludibacteraceae bacterium]|jgi:Holliday junction DNA helicase RuvA|nr:Holliday junction branch migration protein RuvA [Paludibacteraceae bacterium]OPZ01590.1 MAG: Holliday junction ATP-dependent DNA helicase RuvA [Bacteroidetes bacterium ADurb.BinA395]HOF98106.1 Holliday junction branch migration protein RuvA [Paludibacteraceae bacterium]HPL76191.1 Holliday junction branch migration protein RuvA [Paludibacteraceae bacterium]